MKHGNFLILVLAVAVIPIAFTSPVKAAADVNVLSHTGYIDSLGYYHVVGEVQNVGDQPVNFVKVTATFYDSNDAVIATEFTFTMLEVLLAGRKSPFKIILSDKTQSTMVDHYSLSVTFSATSPKPIGLEILSHSLYTDDLGWMHIVGEIKNIATGTANHVKVIATYYDEAGNVVAAAFTFSDPSDINPGEKAPFEILLSNERTPYVASYELTAESTQYAIIPEHPSWTLILLTLATLTVATTICKQKLPKTPTN